MFIHIEELKLTSQKLILTADIDDIIRKKTVPLGYGAHVICPKEYIGRTISARDIIL